MTDQNHMNYLEAVAAEDVAHLREKERTYGGSWKKRGGVGAFMMLARKWDRLEGMLSLKNAVGLDTILFGGYDIFGSIEVDASGKDGTALAEIRDLRRYLLLVEAEMVARGIVPTGPQMELNEESLEDVLIEIRKDGVGLRAQSHPVPVHAVGDPEPVPLTDSNKHADRAAREVVERAAPLRAGINSYELMQLPKDDRARYKWDEDRQEYRLQT